MRYNLLKHNSRNFIILSFKIHFSVINHTFLSSITLHKNHTLWPRHNSTHQFHNKQLASVCNSYAKTQASMQRGTMSMKNHPGALRST